ncbi:TniQ family protein [Paraburkholderia hospita]|uniref:TniQ family protein n=1 Tax=Paraburkholderia hospita TaxID=169430 RepID=UPI0009C8024E|nr:TniQ protein [Paraburkholderia hospita]
MAVSEQRRIQMGPTIPSRKLDLVEPIGIGTGLVEASSSLWKRAAERASVRFGDFVRWAFDGSRSPIDYPHKVTGQLALNRKFLGVDGLTAVAEVYLEPLRRIVASDRIDACTLLPFSGLLCEKRLLRRHRAWCPLCLVSMQSEPGAYEPLLWRLQDVTVCPIHGVDLVAVCHVCVAPNQEVFSLFARVGCCNRCGAWLGEEQVALHCRSVGDSESKVSHTIMNLLGETGVFENEEHDGRFTFRKIITSNKMCDLLASTLDVSPQKISTLIYKRSLPRLAVLAALASAARQPLHRVILGQLVPWTVASRPSEYTLRRRPSRNWKTLERDFRTLAKDPTVVNLRYACEAVNISMGSARTHFPTLVKQIVLKGRALRRERAVSKELEDSIRVRDAFRKLIDAGVYPSGQRVQDISGVNLRNHPGHKRLFAEEWLRAERKTKLRRIRQKSSRLIKRV